MGDTPQGSGWWHANDGRWYPPEQHPDYVTPPPSPEVFAATGWTTGSSGALAPASADDRPWLSRRSNVVGLAVDAVVVVLLGVGAWAYFGNHNTCGAPQGFGSVPGYRDRVPTDVPSAQPGPGYVASMTSKAHLAAICDAADCALQVLSATDPTGVRAPEVDSTYMLDFRFSADRVPHFTHNLADALRDISLLLLRHSADHLAAASYLARSDHEAVFSVGTLARSASETAARSLTLTEKSVAPKVRAARLQNEILYDLRQIERLDPADRDGRVFPNCYRIAEDQARQIGLEVVDSNGREVPEGVLKNRGCWFVEPRSSNTDCVDGWFELVPDRKYRLYHEMSGGAHGTLSALQTRLAGPTTARDALSVHGPVEVEVSNQSVASSVGISTAFHVLAVMAFAHWSGWSTDNQAMARYNEAFKNEVALRD